MIKLLGARKFIDLPAGTLYSEYWLDNVEQCEKMIENFKANYKEFLDTTDLMVYQDNGASLLLEGQKDKYDLTLTDINVVGDANPDCTLRVVFDLNDLPEVITIRGSEYDKRVNWKKEEILRVIKKVQDNSWTDKEFLNWAHKELERRYKAGNRIIDTEVKVTI
jgi:hypothetical protein